MLSGLRSPKQTVLSGCLDSRVSYVYLTTTTGIKKSTRESVANATLDARSDFLTKSQQTLRLHLMSGDGTLVFPSGEVLAVVGATADAAPGERRCCLSLSTGEEISSCL